MSMKILIIRNYPSYIDIRHNTYNIQEIGLAKALTRIGHQCDVLLWTNKQEETVCIPVDKYGEVHVLYRHGKTMLKNTVYISCKTLFSQYDILQPAEYNQMQSWLLAKNQPNKTVIYHGPYYSSFNKRYNLMCKVFDVLFLKRYIKQNTRFLVKSEFAKDFLVKKGIREDNVYVVGVGIDVQMLIGNEEPCTDPLYLRMKNDTSAIKFLYVGQFENRRDIPFIVDVFRKVLEKHGEAKLYMIGTGNEKYLNAVFSYMEQVGVRDKVVWQDRMEQKYLSNIYKLADFFLLPTEYEIFGMVLLEAMYYGTVVLTTSNGGSSILINDGKNGFIFDRKDIKLWVDVVDELLDDSSRMKAIQSLATKRIAECYIWDKIANKFEKVYEELRYRKD